MKNTIICLFVLVILCSCGGHKENAVGFPDWKPGFLDIHHIATGRGNCTLIIMPDGTTMVVDAGDLGDSTQFSQKILPAMPSSELRPAEWQARYIQNVTAPIGRNGHIDYLLFTHFDEDHLGIPYAGAPVRNGYCLTGVTHLCNLLTVDKIVDRGYPRYDFPYPGVLDSTRNDLFDNYRLFLGEKSMEGLAVEGFQVGSVSQFRELNRPHPDFRIINIYASGKIFRDGRVMAVDAPAETFDENNCSCAIVVEYGRFRYHISGDICGVVEDAVGEAEGHVTGMLADHHSYSGGMSREFLAATAPEVVTIPSWDFYHPQPEQLRNMLDAGCKVYSTGMVDTNLERLGEDGAEMSGHGHILVRADASGSYTVYVGDPFRVLP